MVATAVAKVEKPFNELTSGRFGVESGTGRWREPVPAKIWKNPAIESATNRVQNEGLGLKLGPLRSLGQPGQF